MKQRNSEMDSEFLSFDQIRPNNLDAGWLESPVKSTVLQITRDVAKQLRILPIPWVNATFQRKPLCVVRSSLSTF